MATRTATDSVPGLGACGTRNIAKLLSKRQTAYVYLFAHPTQSFVPLPGDGPGSVTVGHATEIPYVFGDVTGLQNVDGERELATQISTYWTNFAKTGNPNDNGSSNSSSIHWPSYKIDEDIILRFDVDVDGSGGTRVQAKLRNDACNWQEKNRIPYSHP